MNKAFLCMVLMITISCFASEKTGKEVKLVGRGATPDKDRKGLLQEVQREIDDRAHGKQVKVPRGSNVPGGNVELFWKKRSQQSHVVISEWQKAFYEQQKQLEAVTQQRDQQVNLNEKLRHDNRGWQSYTQQLRQELDGVSRQLGEFEQYAGRLYQQLGSVEHKLVQERDGVAELQERLNEWNAWYQNQCQQQVALEELQAELVCTKEELSKVKQHRNNLDQEIHRLQERVTKLSHENSQRTQSVYNEENSVPKEKIIGIINNREWLNIAALKRALEQAVGIQRQQLVAKKK